MVADGGPVLDVIVGQGGGVEELQGWGGGAGVHWPDGGALVADAGAVLDVIVDQGEVVKELQGCGGGQGSAPVAADGLAGGQAQDGAQHLPWSRHGQGPRPRGEGKD